MNRKLAFILLLCQVFPLPSWAMEISCPDSKIVIVTDDNTTHEPVCHAVKAGNGFLKSIGLAASEGLTIRLFDKFDNNGESHSVGYYDSRTNEIHLLKYEASLSAFRNSPLIFRVAMSLAVWKSFVVHELAHAAAQKRFVAGVPVWTASEYIAIVAQLATLPVPERENILRNYPELSGFVQQEEISIFYYELEPGKFSINAYLHFLKPENGKKFIQYLLQQGLPDD